MTLETIKVRVRSAWLEAEGIRCYELSDTCGMPMPAFSPGAHISVHLPSGLVRQYSLCSDPEARDVYVVAVQREEQGRGGSKELHEGVDVGDVLTISPPQNNFPIMPDAQRHVFIAGGIGITPILAMIRAIERQNGDWRLHYCVRSADRAAFLSQLSGRSVANRVSLHIDGGDPSRGVDLTALSSAERRPGTYLYCCGPSGLTSAVRKAFSGWPPETIRFESFNNHTSGTDRRDMPFDVEVENIGQIFRVLPGETILEVLRRHGLYVSALCGQGVCGTCMVELVDGVADHRDVVLDDNLRQSKIAVCCSRAFTHCLKIRL